MDTQTSETLAQMESHLKKVTGLLGTLTGSTSSEVSVMAATYLNSTKLRKKERTKQKSGWPSFTAR